MQRTGKFPSIIVKTSKHARAMRVFLSTNIDSTEGRSLPISNRGSSILQKHLLRLKLTIHIHRYFAKNPQSLRYVRTIFLCVLEPINSSMVLFRFRANRKPSTIYEDALFAK
jgi:hypothetical protein